MKKKLMEDFLLLIIRRQRGQALIFVVLVLIIAVFASFLVFDVSHLIKGKIKSRNAVDSAAIVGAQWQRNSLNLIGEINLIKVSEAIFDFADSDANELSSPDEETRRQARDDAEAASDELTELQLRVAFVGPMIGFGAAQQAAKNNGVSGHRAMTLTLREHYKLLNDPDIYGSGVIPPIVYGYEWRIPYMKLINDNLVSTHSSESVVAVGCNMDMMADPLVTSDGGVPIDAYCQRSVLKAILATPNIGWCRLKNLLLNYESEFRREKWWGNITVIVDHALPRGSELLSIGLTTSEGQNAIIDSAEYLLGGSGSGVLNDADRISENQLLFNKGANDKLTFQNPEAFQYLSKGAYFVYGSNWGHYGEEKLSYWEKYLDGKFKPELAYNSGALSFMTVRISNATLTGKYFKDGNKIPDINLGHNEYRKSLEKAYKYNYYTNDSFNTALAKPIGYLELGKTKVAPFMSSLVLPVFDDVIMIPVSLEFPGYSKLQDPEYFAFKTKYLPELGTRDTIEEMSDWIAKQAHPEYYWQYHSALLKLNDPAYRQRGIAWLKQPYYKIVGKDADGNLIEELDGTNADHCYNWYDTPFHFDPPVLH